MKKIILLLFTFCLVQSMVIAQEELQVVSIPLEYMNQPSVNVSSPNQQINLAPVTVYETTHSGGSAATITPSGESTANYGDRLVMAGTNRLITSVTVDLFNLGTDLSAYDLTMSIYSECSGSGTGTPCGSGAGVLIPGSVNTQTVTPVNGRYSVTFTYPNLNVYGQADNLIAIMLHASNEFNLWVIDETITTGSNPLGEPAMSLVSRCGFSGANGCSITGGVNNNFGMTVVAEEDAAPPTAICQDITVQLDAAGNATITPAQIDNGSSDPEGTVTLSLDITSFDCSNTGANTVTLTVTDEAGNTATCTATVTVEDNIPPAITCPADITQDNDPGICGAVVNYTAPVGTDNCTGSTTTQTAGLPSGSTFPVGTTTNTFVVTDASGNTASCSFDVIVNDTEDPVITCPADITVSNDPGDCGAVVTFADPTATDNCPIINSQTFTFSGTTESFVVPAGVTSITIDAEGAQGGLNGGLGASISGTFAVTPGETLNIMVGGEGGSRTNNAGVGGGGGGSFVWNATGPTLLIAAGGGGGNAGNGNSIPGPGSDTNIATNSINGGGNASGGAGGNGGAGGVLISTATCEAGGGGGAGWLSNGSNGAGPNPPPSGGGINPLSGGAGGAEGANCTFPPSGSAVGGFGGGGGGGGVSGAGGGGGGYNGGGGGNSWSGSPTTGWGAGGGGGSFNGGSSQSNVAGVRSGNGQIIISYGTIPVATQTAGLPSGSLFPIGTTTNTFVTTDGAGNTATCSFDVIVNDTEPPVATCPADITVSNAAGMCSAVVNFAGSVTDNCPGATLSYSPASGSSFPVGTTLVTATATDASGNMSTCTFNVTVNDTELPAITCPADITQDNDPGVCGAVVSYTTPVGTDNCAGSTTTQTAGLPSGSTFPVGTTTNTFEVTDASGNTTTCSFDVTINDAEAPVITCPGDITVSNDPGVCGAVVNYSVTATDNCTTAINQMPGQTSIFTGNARGYWFVAPADFVMTGLRVPNTASAADQNIQVMRFASAPVNFPGTSSYDALLHWSGLTPGNNFIPVNIPVSEGDIIGILGTRGTNSTNSYTSSGTPMVINGINVPIARFGTQTDIHAAAAPNGTFWTEPFANNPNKSRVEFEYESPVVTQTAGLPSGSVFPVGTTTNTFEARDGAGNVVTCSFDVTVNDTEVPTITCPADITVSNDPGVCEAFVTVPAPTFTDNCFDASGCLQTDDIESYVTGPILGQDPLWQTWTPNTLSESGEVSTEQAFSGTQSIKITGLPAGGPVDQTYLLGNRTVGVWQVTYNMYIPVGNTAFTNIQKFETAGTTWANQIQWNSNGTVDYNVNGTTSSFGYPQGQWFEVVHYVDLDNDNSEFRINGTTLLSHPYSQDSFTTGPTGVLQLGSVDFFPTTNFYGNDPSPGAIPLFYVDDVSLCAIPINNYNNTADASDTYPVGTTNVIWTVTDGAGNTSTCNMDVTVTDNEPPVAICMDITVQLDASGMASITGADIDGGSTDNCGIASLTASPNSFSCADVGPNTVTLTVTDVNGNTSTCTATVTVEDNVPPTAVCMDITIQLDANGMASIVAGDIDGGSTDACGIASIMASQTDFDCSHVGPNNVTLTVTDVNGNVSTCVAVVTVEDNVPPVIACPGDINVSTTPGDCFAEVTFADAIALDACGIASVVQTMGPPSGSQFPVGTTTIEFTATDVNGNTSTCTFDITVTDDEPAMAVCMDITVQLDATGNVSIVPGDVDGGSSDNCGIASMTVTPNSFTCADVGDNPVVLEITDVNGNVSSCTAIVTVEDVTAPVASCMDITVQLDATGTVTITGADVDGGSSDACGIADLSVSPDTFDCDDVGDNTVTLTVTDVNGNTSTCTAIVTVEDNIAPVLTCMDITLELDENGMASITPDDVIASNTDNCGIATSAVDITDFDCDDIGTPVTVTVFTVDVNGNLASCTAVVTVVDLLGPDVTCPADQTVDPGPGNLFYTVPDYFATGEATATDNCTDPVTIFSQTPAAGTQIPDGVYTVEVCATDEYGNESCCTFELTVESILGNDEITVDFGSITMYPNPARDVVMLSNPQSLALDNVAIYDATGRLIRTLNLKDMGTEKQIEIYDLASATYLFVISGDNGQITKQIIKE
jgi:hypothetical protein